MQTCILKSLIKELTKVVKRVDQELRMGRMKQNNFVNGIVYEATLRELHVHVQK